MIMYIKTGIQLYTCRNEFFADTRATFERLAKMGYDGVEFFMGFDMPAKELKGLLDDYGLQPCGWHTGLHLLENELIYSTMEYHAGDRKPLYRRNASPRFYGHCGKMRAAERSLGKNRANALPKRLCV